MLCGEGDPMAERIALHDLNALPAAEFIVRLSGIFEHSPWVPEAVLTLRPFADVGGLHAAMLAAVDMAGNDAALTLLRAHPELARRATLTAESAAEQGGMGLDRLAEDEAARFEALNLAYREHFGFPFIIAVRGQRDRAAILVALTERLAHDAPTEQAAALAEVAKIARFRLDDLIVG
jgi:2-oxo-4-hydroxy-4-carboxy-5-ureidoimidazoline decarboxylase